MTNENQGTIKLVLIMGAIAIIIVALILMFLEKIVVAAGDDFTSWEISILAIGLAVSSGLSAWGLRYTAKEAKEARKERNLSLVGSFSSQLTSLKDKERNLKSKKDCETYAQNFVDLVDQIAYLYLKKSLPDDVADFFENELSYALTMIEWMNTHPEIEKKLIIIPVENICDGIFHGQIFDEKEKVLEEIKITLETTPEKFDPDKNTLTNDIRILDCLDYNSDKIVKVDISKVLQTASRVKNNEEEVTKYEQYQIDKQYPWTSLIERCIEKNIVPFETDQQLPQTMLAYNNLPSDEQDKIMEVINQYSTQITELKAKEESLTTKNDCETYASNFVDLMDQIAFLYDKNTFPPETHEYFINDFEYALTMIVWLENNGAACELRKGIIDRDTTKKNENSRWKDLMIQYDTNKQKIIDEAPKLEIIRNKIDEVNKEIAELDKTANDFLTKKKSLELKKVLLKEKVEKRQKEFSWDSLIKLSNDKDYEPLDPSSLPIPMREYQELPDEVMDKTLDLIKDYGDKLSKLTLQEQKLEQENDVALACELYANSYIDLLDNIAFLHNKKALPEKVAKYFENNFCYALTLINYLIDTEVAEQSELPIVVSINKKEGKFAEMKINEWLEKRVPKKWVTNNLTKIDQKWFSDNLKDEKFSYEDLESWIYENDEDLKKEIDGMEKNIAPAKGFAARFYQKLENKTHENLEKIMTVGNQYTWTDLMMWCKANNLTSYDINQLPPVMRKRGMKGRIKILEKEISKIGSTNKVQTKKCVDEINELKKKVLELDTIKGY